MAEKGIDLIQGEVIYGDQLTEYAYKHQFVYVINGYCYGAKLQVSTIFHYAVKTI